VESPAGASSGTAQRKRPGQGNIVNVRNWLASVLGHKSMALSCGYSSPRSDCRTYSQVTGARVHVPLGHEPFGHVRCCQPRD
jgi:hypothetical protein